MNNYKVIQLLFIFVSLIIFISFSTEQKMNNHLKVSDFFEAKSQYHQERIIKRELKSVRSVNISEELNIYRAYLLAYDQNQITIFDKPNYGFYQFDNNLNYIGKFGSEGRGPGEFILPMGMIIDGDGNFRVIGDQVRKVSIFSPAGELMIENPLPSGILPHRYASIGSNTHVLFTILGQSLFHIFNDDGELLNSFLNFTPGSQVSFTKRGLFTDGYIAGIDDGIIYYVGTRNSMIKAFYKNGEMIFSRETIMPFNYDLNMTEHEIRSSPLEALDIAVYRDKICVLYIGDRNDDYWFRYLDIYDRGTGDYLYSFVLESPSLKISISEHSDNFVVLGYDGYAEEMSLFMYENPFQ